MLPKFIVLAMLALILISLFSALALLFRKEGDDKRQRVVQALTVRISLSIVLFLMLLAGFYFGIIPQQGLK